MANVIDIKNTELTIEDEGGANSLTVTFGEGNLTWSESVNNEYILDKGSLDTVRLGDEVPLSVSFQGVLDYYKGDSTVVTIEDALKQKGEASAWVGVQENDSGQECAPYAVDLVLVNEPSCGTGITNPIETITFPTFRADQIDFDVRAGTVSVSGQCLATEPTSVRSA